MQQSTTPTGRVVCLFHPFSRGKVEKKIATDSEIDDTRRLTRILCQTTSTSNIEVYLSLTNSWPSYLSPKLPYPAKPFKAKVHSPKGLNSARIISQDHRRVPSKCIHSSLRPQEACRHSIFSVHPVLVTIAMILAYFVTLSRLMSFGICIWVWLSRSLRYNC